jgi:uncharacterized protein
MQERGRVLMVYGPRRVGKTTLLKRYLERMPMDTKKKYDVGDDLALRQLFGSEMRKDILDYAAPFDVIAIDEAQRIPSIGLAAKMLIDEFPDKKIILTGSSSFNLAQSVGEPLVGRHYMLPLFPIAWQELEGSNFEKKRNIADLLVYGAYPEILLAETVDAKKLKLDELISSYLFKDILAFERLKSPELLLAILRALAWQIGSEVSLNELARAVGERDHKKIGRYLEILEKAFVVKKVSAYSSNQRKEIRKPVKYYFYDLGIRNAIIGQFEGIAVRSAKEIGMLWENFVFMEMIKKSVLEGRHFDTFFFWRNKAGREVDIVRKTGDGELFGYECKWSPTEVVFSDFLELYPKAKTGVVSRENIDDVLAAS